MDFNESDLIIIGGYDAVEKSQYRDSHIRIEPNDEQSAVRVTHIPTGMSVVCFYHRSQLRNKQVVMEGIRAMVEAA